MAERTQRKVREGVVVSSAMNKTIVVRMKRKLPHSVYGKYVTQDKKFYAHDEKNECQVGDRVRIMETRPLSKLKRWRLVEVIERAR
jgi:small subunit ribosomal protein S17